VISLIISDVVGDDLGTIASGPTFPDSTTFKDAYHVLQKYGLLDKAPPHVIEYIQMGCDSRVPETLKN